MQPILRLGERSTIGVVRPPRPSAFMLERAWARRLYHLAFAALLFGAWWYLGTNRGAAEWAAMINRSRY